MMRLIITNVSVWFAIDFMIVFFWIVYMNKIYSHGSFECRHDDEISVTCSTQRRHCLHHDVIDCRGVNIA